MFPFRIAFWRSDPEDFAPERVVPIAQVGAGAAGGGLGTPYWKTVSVLKGRFGAVL